MLHHRGRLYRTHLERFKVLSQRGIRAQVGGQTANKDGALCNLTLADALERILPAQIHPLPVVLEEQKHPADGDQVGEKDMGPQKVRLVGDVHDAHPWHLCQGPAGVVVDREQNAAHHDAVEYTKLQTHPEEAQEHDGIQTHVVDVELLGHPHRGHDPAHESERYWR